LDYTKSEAILKCPSAAGTGAFDYSYNSLMSGKNENKVAYSATTVLAAESSRNTAAQAAPSASARTRHFDGSNYAFVDGHVKWIKGTVVATETSGNSPTFFVPLTSAEQSAAADTFPLAAGGELKFLYVKAYNGSTYGPAVSNLSTDINLPTPVRSTVTGTATHIMAYFSNSGAYLQANAAASPRPISYAGATPNGNCCQAGAPTGDGDDAHRVWTPISTGTRALNISVNGKITNFYIN